MIRSILAVMAGIAGSSALALLSGALMVFLRADGKEMAAGGIIRLAAVCLVLEVVQGVFGGWVCVRIARGKQQKHLLAVMIAGELVLAAALIVFWGRQPIWYGTGMLAIFGPSVLLGGRAAMAWETYDEADVLAWSRR